MLEGRTMSFYRPLNHHENEIRVVNILDTPADGDETRVHCSLEHVSLNEFTTLYQDFVTNRSLSDPNTTKDWIYQTGTLDPAPFEVGRPQELSIPLWRLAEDYPDGNPHIPTLAAGTFPPSNLSPIPTPLKLVGDEGEPSAIESPNTQQIFSALPRFTWGDFEAISYCWESEERERIIVLDNQEILVPKNLEAALQATRDLPERNHGMKFWVDFLCINQDDTQEKNYQVKLMQSIFTKAFAIIVWLGPEIDDSEQAIDLLALVASYDWDDEKYWKQERTSSSSLFDLWFKEMPWTALYSFLSRNYWQRLWIIQELALNHNMTLFLCGKRQLSRSMLWKACAFCMGHEGKIDHVLLSDIRARDPSSVLIHCPNHTVWHKVYHVHKLVMIRGPTTETGDMERVLDLGRKAIAKDPRDKVYGILGILPESITDGISPNYTLSYEQVYLEFMEKAMSRFDSLDAILAWCHFNPSSLIPSWVPDWRAPFPRNHIQWLRKRRAAGDSKAEGSLSADKKTLHCRGFVFDIITNISAAPAENIPFETDLSLKSPTSSSQTPSAKSTDLPNRYGSKDLIAAALRRTLIHNHPKQNSPKTILNIYWLEYDTLRSVPKDSKQLADLHHGMKTITSSNHWRPFDQFRQTNANFSVLDHTFRSFFPDMRTYMRPMLFWKPPDLWPYPEDEYYPDSLGDDDAYDMKLCELSLHGRRLFTTKTGWLGMAPEMAKAGDVVAILCGCNFPVVLRKSDHEDGKEETWKVVGECFIDGVMEGQLMDAAEKGEYAIGDVVLC
ncbi:heterokaryon incompatibility protein-domain-containing protein [Halenospora varia]|nr:heterokaryon incompatibility protein-domain-containing protein [Halenospora varia]